MSNMTIVFFFGLFMVEGNDTIGLNKRGGMVWTSVGRGQQERKLL